MTSIGMALVLSRQYVRSPLLVLLALVVPFLFITLSYYTTQDVPLDFYLRDDGERFAASRPMPDVHGAIMVPITAAFLSGMTGLFVMLEAKRTDARLVVAGVSAVGVALTRLLLIMVMAAIVAALAVAIDLLSFRPDHLSGFTLANILVAMSYGFIGALAGLVAGRLGGAYLMLFLPMIDVGIFQDPMLISGEPDIWMKLLPGFGGSRFALDSAFSQTADDWVALLAACAWAVLLAGVAVAVFTRKARS